MRCKTCYTTAKSSTAMKRHCWEHSQQCVPCHYLGMKNMRAVKVPGPSFREMKEAETLI